MTNSATKLRQEIGPLKIYSGPLRGKVPDGHFLTLKGSEGQVCFDIPLCARARPGLIAQSDFCILGHAHEDHLCGFDLLGPKPLYAPRQDLARVISLEGLCDSIAISGPERDELYRRFVDEFHIVARPDAIPYDDGHVWDLGDVKVRAIHAPGHTPGHSILMIEPHGIALIGDIDLTGFGPFYGDRDASLAQFRATLALVRDLDAKAWVSFHHKGGYLDRDRFLADLERYEAVFQKRENLILARLDAGASNLDALASPRWLFPQSYASPGIDAIERHMMKEHLDEMVGQGRLILSEDGTYCRSS